MSGELLAMRRAAVGAPIAEYSRLVDRARVNKGGKGTSAAAPQPVTATSLSGVTATASATPHTKGDWVELIASTGFAAETLQIVVLTVTASSTANTSTLVDIGTGAAASEVALISNVPIGHQTGTTGVGQAMSAMTYIFQGLAVPAGTRISARIQSVVVSQTARIGVALRQAGGPIAAGTTVTTYGADTATSNGTIPTVAGSINTKSDWTEITASTTADIRSFLVAISTAGGATQTANDGLVDIGIGAAASETVIVADIPYVGSATESHISRGCEVPFIRAIPAGSRLSFRYQSTSTANGARPTAVILGIN